MVTARFDSLHIQSALVAIYNNKETIESTDDRLVKVKFILLWQNGRINEKLVRHGLTLIGEFHSACDSSGTYSRISPG